MIRTRRRITSRERVRSAYDAYTQWMLDRFSNTLIDLWAMGEQAGASVFETAVDGGTDATIEGAWNLGQTPIVWDGPDEAVADGSTAYAEVPDKASLEIGPSQSATFGCWFRPDVDSTAYKFLNKRTNGNGQGYEVGTTSGGEIFATLEDGGGETVFLASGVTASSGTTYFVCVTVDRTVDKSTIFVDGVAEDTKDISSIDDMSDSAPLNWGRRSSGTQHYSGGLNFGFFADRVLTDDEVAVIHRRGRI